MRLKKTYTLEEATKKLEHYCAYQERCHFEVRQKLESLHMIPEAIDLVMVHLIKDNFLNEERFAKAFVSGKFKIKKWGKIRLANELKKKGINKVIINHSLAEIEDTEYLKVFNELAQKKALATKDANKLKKKKKIIDYLLYRGWESHLVYNKVDELVT